MCGICGQFNYNSGAPVADDHIERMTASMIHRGPDDKGTFVSGSIGLGFRRLSIIDLSPRGHQPMSDAGQSVWVVFNGEIYNFRELRKELEGHGHVFSSRTDTEVIVHGYRQWGVEVLNHLDGMFGLAVWDAKRRLLMLARDRTGIKPLYYQVNADGIRFASEIRALLAVTEAVPKIDIEGLSSFLRYRYTPSPQTLIDGIHKLAPGFRLIATSQGCKTERWWNFCPEPFEPMPSLKKATTDLLDIYSSAVKQHLISDVPVGLLLSGGLDSGLLLGLMSQYGADWRTYTVGFGNDFKQDELSAAATTADFYKTPNTPVLIDHSTFCDSLPRVVSLLEEPVASCSVVGMYHVCKRAREDVKVVLMGQGPDELFGGYRRHLGVRYGAFLRMLPQFLQKQVLGTVGRLSRDEMFQRALYSLQERERLRRYQQVFSIVSDDSMRDILRQDVYTNDSFCKMPAIWQDMQPWMKHTDELGGLQFLEMRSSLPDELLMYGDKLSMAHSLEARLPYLDRSTVEYVERLSAAFKVRFGSRKWLHRRVCRQFLPRAVVKRPKIGFAAPVDEWFGSLIQDKFKDYLLDPSSLIYEYVNLQAVHNLLSEHQSRVADHHKMLYSLITLEEWMRQLHANRLQMHELSDYHAAAVPGNFQNKVWS